MSVSMVLVSCNELFIVRNNTFHYLKWQVSKGLSEISCTGTQLDEFLKKLNINSVVSNINYPAF